MPQEPRLKLTGALKDETFRNAVIYHATGTYDGKAVEIPESNLKLALNALPVGTLVEVALKERRGGNPDTPCLFLTVDEIGQALAHIDRIAPADRPNPLLALA